jgi:hypothetical protein
VNIDSRKKKAGNLVLSLPCSASKYFPMIICPLDSEVGSGHAMMFVCLLSIKFCLLSSFVGVFWLFFFF